MCGLGNPGTEYAHTRHNLGFMFLDRMSTSLNAEMLPGKGDYLIARAAYLDRPVYLVKPLTYVNNSGIAIRDAAMRFEIPLEKVLVVCDDCELPFGVLRLRGKGSDGGHHGLESVIYHLESEEFPRLRIGIGKPPSVDLTEYVLSRFEPDELERVPEILTEAERAVKLFLDLGVSRAMSLVNRRAEVE